METNGKLEHTYILILENNKKNTMKRNRNINFKKLILLGLVLITTISCQRDLSDDASLSNYSKNPDVFIDSFSAGLGYGAFGGSKYTAFVVDTDVKYQGTASMRFDVPNVGDPAGAYAGGVFIDQTGRDLSSYDALTFWIKSTQGANINELGFGTDFGDNKYNVVLQNLSVGTSWQKVIIPIPDASKLTREKGMFWYAEGPENGFGYTFWIDNVRYEKLGTIGQPLPKIFNGSDNSEQTFIGSVSNVTGLTDTFNLENGANETITVAPSYYAFKSSDETVATVSELGVVTVVGAGTSVITAKLAGVDATGSLTITSLGVFTAAPVPTRDPANVISIFSDAYTNVPVEYYNGYYAPYQTTQGQADININGDHIIKYSQLNFVGTQFSQPTVNGSQMTHLHVDIQVQEPIQPADYIKVQVVDFGNNGVFGGGDDTSGIRTFPSSTFTNGNWISLDIPLSTLTGLTNKAHLAQILFISDATISNILVDNMYFYKIPTTPTVAAPTPTLPAANVISLFSGAYSNVPVDTWRTSWSSATFADVTVAGNATKEYSNLDFVGIETVNNQINASAMTSVHLDVWSANFTSFSIKLVDFGADGAFGGGDDKEHQLNFPAPLQNQWISYDIPLASFTGLTTRQHLAQYILVAQPSGSAKVYVDNFYFHN